GLRLAGPRLLDGGARRAALRSQLVAVEKGLGERRAEQVEPGAAAQEIAAVRGERARVGREGDLRVQVRRRDAHLRARLPEQSFGGADVRPLARELRWNGEGELTRHLQLGQATLWDPRPPRPRA